MLRLCGVISIALLLGLSYAEKSTAPSPRLLEDCFSSKKLADQDACLDQTVIALLQTISTIELMNYIVASSSPTILATNCHEISHVIGQKTYSQNTSLEGALAKCSAECNRGCIHGVVTAAVVHDLGAASAKDDVIHAQFPKVLALAPKYCAESGALCHAMGHLMYMGKKDILSALHMCDAIAPRIWREPCREGVFMEASGKDAFGDPPLHTDSWTMTYPCSEVPETYLAACFLYLTDFQTTVLERMHIPPADWPLRKGMACENFSGTARAMCFHQFGDRLRILNNSGKRDISKTVELCETFNTTDAGSCIVGRAQSFVSGGLYGAAITTCTTAFRKHTDECFATILKKMSGILSYAEVQQLCTDNNSPACTKALIQFWP